MTSSGTSSGAHSESGENIQPVPNLPAAELLDASSLSTVLDIVEAIETSAELTLLETLTPVQKRQVWDALSEAQKQRLKRIRAAGAGATVPAAPLPVLPLTRTIADSEIAQSADSDETDADETDFEETDFDETETADAEAIAADSLALGTESIPEADLRPALALATQPTVGDRVVLLPQPLLTTAELKAIWDVVAIEDSHAQIRALSVGARRYPLSWLVIYPDPEF